MSEHHRRDCRFLVRDAETEDWYRKNPAIDAAIAARSNATYEA
jgi:uncharacterized protein (DUF924 family)